MKKRAAAVLAYFDRPGTSHGPTEAINGAWERAVRGHAMSDNLARDRGTRLAADDSSPNSRARIGATVRICYIHQYFNTPDMGGGTRSYEMARRFVEAGHEVFMVTSDRTGSGTRRTTVHDGIRVHWIPISYSNNMAYGDRMRAFFNFAASSIGASKKSNPDVVLATSTPLTVAVPGLTTRLSTRAPMVLEVRDLWPELPIAMGALPSRGQVLAARALEQAAYRGAARVIALSPGMADGIASAGYPRDRIDIVPNSSDVKLFQENDKGRSFLDRNPRLRGRDTILYAGALGTINGVEFLVRVANEAAHQAPEIAFVVVGDGRERDAIQRAASSTGVLDRNFFLLPRTSKRDITSAFAASTAVCSLFIDIPAMEHNSANKFFDGLAAGKPILINYGGWQADLLKRHQNGLRLSRDPAQAANEVVDLVQNKRLLRAMGTRSLDLAQQEFSRDILAERLLENLRMAVEPASH